jgi:predicted anti-sigma-YlaC factor YlaD
MSTAASCREIRHSLGVYVLGAIEPSDRAQVDEHLATCADCREELASLAGLPALLRRVPTAEAERLAVAGQADSPTGETPPDDLLPSLLARTTQARRVRRWRELAAAAAVVVLALGAGAAGASLLGSGPAAAPAAHGQAASHTWHRVSAVDGHTGATLTVKYASVHWGTLMTAQVSGIPAGTVCQFQVTDAQGHHMVVGGWRVEYQGRPAWYPASTSLTDSNLQSFQVTAGGKVIASVSAA